MPELRSASILEIPKPFLFSTYDFGWCSTLFVTAVLIRVFYISLIGIPSQEGGDMNGYIALARNLVAGYGFTDDGITASTYRPPLFSWILAGWCYLFGSTSLTTMVAYQIFVQSLCGPLTYVCTWLVSGRRSFALAGGAFVSVYPFVFATIGLILQEPTQMLIATATAIVILLWCQKSTMLRAAIVGLFFGLSALAKTPNLLAPLIVFFVWLLAREFRLQLPLKQIIVGSVVMLMMVAPWTLRNYLVTGGKFIPVNSQGSAVLIWMVTDGKFRVRESLSDPAIDNTIKQEGIFLSYGNNHGIEHLTRVNDELLERGISGDALQEAIGKASASYLVNNPGYTFRHAVKGVILFIAPDSGPLAYKYPRLRVLAMLLFHLPLFVGFTVGMCCALLEKDAAVSIISLNAVAYLLIHLLVATPGRYTVPLIPVLLAVTAYGGECLIKRFRFSNN